MNFISQAIPMTRAGLVQGLSRLGFESAQTAALWTVFEVETGSTTQGFGFRVDRRPQILFERHKFCEFTDGQFNKSDPDISGPQGTCGPLAIQYTKLERALQLCEQQKLGVEPALKSASWGIGQVMGFILNCALRRTRYCCWALGRERLTAYSATAHQARSKRFRSRMHSP